jgi:phosphatidate cytidylyltransferase
MLRWRLVIGPILIAALIGLFSFDARVGRTAPILYGLCLFLVIRSVWELKQLLRVRSFAPHFWLATAGCVAIVTAGWVPWWLNSNPTAGAVAQLGPMLLTYTLSVIALLVSGGIRYRAPGTTLETLGAELLMLTYVGLFTAVTAQLRWVSPLVSRGNGLIQIDVGYLALASLIVATKCGDTAAFFAGRSFGRTKLMPLLSPGKTWAGAYGAIVGAALGSWAWLHWGTLWLTTAAPGPWYWAVLYGAVLGVVGMVGDLCESLIKRDVGQKDSAPLLPGFGGLLDLLDSVIFTGPVAYLLWLWLPLLG